MGDGYAPAHIAIDNDDVECLKICLRWGADSEVRNFKSETPQQLAYLFNNKDPNCEMVSGSIMSFSKWAARRCCYVGCLAATSSKCLGTYSE